MNSRLPDHTCMKNPRNPLLQHLTVTQTQTPATRPICISHESFSTKCQMHVNGDSCSALLLAHAFLQLDSHAFQKNLAR